MNEKEHITIIAANIKRLIKEKGINQKILAKAIDISPSTITEYMQLRTRPSHGVIQKMADYFGVLKSDIDTTWKTENLDSSYIDETLKTMELLEEPRQKIILETAKIQLEDQNKLQEERNKIISLQKEQPVDDDMVWKYIASSGGRPFTEEDKQATRELFADKWDEIVQKAKDLDSKK